MTTTSGERADLLQALGQARHFLRHTADGLTEDRARERSTASELTVGGLVKHVTSVEAQWCDFIENGPPGGDPDYAAHAASFVLGTDETLAGALAAHEAAAARTDALLGSVDLDEAHALPEAPWNEPGTTWTNRRVFIQLIAETAQHAGHADILRETIDGQKTMG